jgi:hypothetical protein
VCGAIISTLELNDAHLAVDHDDLSGDVCAGIRGEQQHGTFEIVFVSEFSERRLLNQPGAMFGKRQEFPWERSRMDSGDPLKSAR